MIVINLTQNTILCRHTEIADTFFSRARGLLGRKSLPMDAGMVITRCQSIHMFFMKFSIDVVFIDNAGIVVGAVTSIKPWRLSPVFWKAAKVIELPEKTIEKTKTKVGDCLEIK
ncbi:MAG: DUF192 domain-containing protein [Candidatus Omnitrophota bacterium]